MQFITFWDFILLPLYVFIIYWIAYRVRARHYPVGHPWRPYFLPGLTVKVVGALFIGLLYQYYYRSGDTLNYFHHATIINSARDESIGKWLNLLFRLVPWYEGGYTDYISRLYWYYTPKAYMVPALTAFVNVFTFDTFLPSSIIFAGVAFTGIWALFRTFATQYPHLVRHIAIAVLFVPSTFIWGSGIFKDTICMFGLGWMTYGTFVVLVQRRFSLSTIALTALGFYLVAVIKIYILLAYLPALALWVLFYYSHKIPSAATRAFLKVGVGALTLGGFVLLANSFAEELEGYSLENVAKTTAVTRDWIIYSSGETGSTYDIGKFEPTIAGMLSKVGPAINVALFRPYLWEARKPIVMLNALEAAIFLFITLKIVIMFGPRKVWQAIQADPIIQFCLIFTLIFAFSVGISSGNFGALSRYRIPCLPLYALALVLVYYQYRPPEKRFLSFS